MICVPWRHGTGRADLWHYNRARWESWGFQVFTGDNPEPRFNVAAARNNAARSAGDWDVAVFADADVLLTDPVQAERACEVALKDDKYVAAYRTFHWLDQPTTRRVLNGAAIDSRLPAREMAGVYLNCFAISRALWDRVGGFDQERFKGIAWEDVSFLNAVHALGAGPENVPGGAYHLWHPARQSIWGDPV